MQIPQELPHFSDNPTLLIVGGNFEVRFFVGKNNIIEEKSAFKMSPREEARESQAFIDKRGGKPNMGAFSHHDRYVEDLKEKVSKRLYTEINELAPKYGIKDIYLFLPSYSHNKLMEKIPTIIKSKIKKIFSGEYINESPIEILKIIQRDEEKNRPSHIHTTNEEKKIIHRPDTKPRFRK